MDHPRSRGEYVNLEKPVPRLIGSSPLSRGIQIDIMERNGEIRIIPALAGNTGALERAI